MRPAEHVWAVSVPLQDGWRHHWTITGTMARAVCRQGGVHYREDIDTDQRARRCPHCMAGTPAPAWVRRAA